MFVNYSLEDIKKAKIVLENKVQIDDLNVIIEAFEAEGFDVTEWHLFEKENIRKGKRVYGFEGSSDNFFYVKIDDRKKVIPYYFKNHDVDGYSLFEATTIKEAIRLYENFYSPKLTKEEMKMNIEEIEKELDEIKKK